MAQTNHRPGSEIDMRRNVTEQWLGEPAHPSCLVEWCPQARHKRGYCPPHYARLQRLGDPEGGEKGYHGEAWAWLLEMAHFRTGRCVEWPYRRDRHGYGTIRTPGRDSTTKAHREVLTLIGGEPPTADTRIVAMHICENPPCINPLHLRWGTDLDNAKHRDR